MSACRSTQALPGLTLSPDAFFLTPRLGSVASKARVGQKAMRRLDPMGPARRRPNTLARQVVGPTVRGEACEDALEAAVPEAQRATEESLPPSSLTWGSSTSWDPFHSYRGQK